MKNKNVAGILALIFPYLGLHRFYLGDVGRGIFYVFLAFGLIGSASSAFVFMFILGFIDAMSFFTMSEKKFDKKYNKEHRTDYNRRRRGDTDYERRNKREDYREKRRESRRERADDRSGRRTERAKSTRRNPASNRQTSTRRTSTPRANPFKQSGIKKFKEYEYAGAIADFEEALKINPNDIAIHFNLACAYSLTEQKDKAYSHLEKAVALGFQHTDKIATHEALAYLRVQDDFDDFVANGYRVKPAAQVAQEAEKKAITQQEEDLLSTKPDLLDQLKKLGELRERGLLTEMEFAEQKRRLMG